jgi:hypothetical protein
MALLLPFTEVDLKVVSVRAYCRATSPAIGISPAPTWRQPILAR